MTTPGEMVKCAAQVLGVQEVSLTLIDRQLVGHGLRTKGGRGRSAAKMTARDVANLLIGWAGGDLVKDAADTVRAYGELPQKQLGKPSAWVLEGFPALQALPVDHTLADALTALLQSAADGDFERAEAALLQSHGSHRLGPALYIDVQFHAPLREAAISVRGSGVVREDHSYSAMPGDTDSLVQFISEQNLGDGQRIQMFTHKTILEMGRFLRGEG